MRVHHLEVVDENSIFLLCLHQNLYDDLVCPVLEDKYPSSCLGGDVIGKFFLRNSFWSWHARRYSKRRAKSKSLKNIGVALEKVHRNATTDQFLCSFTHSQSLKILAGTFFLGWHLFQYRPVYGVFKSWLALFSIKQILPGTLLMT